MTQRAQGEMFPSVQSVIGLNKTNLLLKNDSDLMLEEMVKMSNDRLVSEKKHEGYSNHQSTSLGLKCLLA